MRFAAQFLRRAGGAPPDFYMYHTIPLARRQSPHSRSRQNAAQQKPSPRGEGAERSEADEVERPSPPQSTLNTKGESPYLLKKALLKLYYNNKVRHTKPPASPTPGFPRNFCALPTHFMELHSLLFHCPGISSHLFLSKGHLLTICGQLRILGGTFRPGCGGKRRSSVFVRTAKWQGGRSSFVHPRRRKRKGIAK